MEEPFYPLVRLANVEDWDGLERNTRDSVFTRIPPIAIGIKSSGVAADAELVLRTHKYIQDSLRYVSLAFSDRAYVPAYPDSVMKHKMGDCKDFAVYMISKLRQAGIAAYPALVNSRFRHAFFPGPPSYDAVNHMIVYVPGRNWWVDPTAGVNPPGLLPFHLSDAQALVLYPDSINLMRLPRNDDSAYAGGVTYRCREQGRDLRCVKRTTYSRKDSWGMRSYLKGSPKEKWKELLHPPDWSGARRSATTRTSSLRSSLKVDSRD